MKALPSVSDMLKAKPIPIIDLFCGAGGMTLGFTSLSKGRFASVWANDNNRYAVETYNRNFGPHCVHGDIVDILGDPTTKIPEAVVVIGGPPCQGFSLLNKNREGDPRKQLWRPYFEIVKRSHASVFVMENVPQILSSPERYEIEEAAEKMGFKLAVAKLCAADYGVPQIRWRAVIIGCRFDDPTSYFPPRKTHHKPKGAVSSATFELDDGTQNRSAPWRTVKDAIADLAPPSGIEKRDAPPPYDLHFGRTPSPTSLARYQAIPEEGMNRFDLQRNAPEITPGCWIRKTSGGTDLFGRLWWERPAFTIRTEFFKPEKGRYLHPSQHRPLTHREAARLQSFPDSFIFCGSKIEIARQIGNAVPPMLAAHIAESVSCMLNPK
jgi:DNA (cytosine-5)-methyltransferase 1